ncbi:MAG: carbonic anhydrase [Planctomycetota bacterium]|jgi:carbonic anhydrase
MNAAQTALFDQLSAGNQRFCIGQSRAHEHSLEARLEAASGKRKAHIVILGCVDGRVPPELVFDLELGQAFVLRTPGGIIDAGSAAALELAALELKPKLMVVLGHGGCLAVQAALDGPGSNSPVLRPMLDKLEPCLEGLRGQHASPERTRKGVHAATRNALAEARAQSPALAELEASGAMTCLGAYYDLESGRVDWLE